MTDSATEKAIESEANNSQTANTHMHEIPIDFSKTNLTFDQQNQLKYLLNEFHDIFAKDEHDLGKTDIVQHKIDVGDHPPIKSTPYRVPYCQRSIISQQVKSMLDNNIIKPSTSPWSSNVVLVKKKNGKQRFCIDFRKLNSITKKENYPLPRIDETIDSLGNACFFTTLDLASGYWQIAMAPEDTDKTAFTTFCGHFEFNRMPFGLTNAAPRCQQLMEFLLAGLQWHICLCYLDDIIIYSRSFAQHLQHLRQVFERLRNAGLKLRLETCSFCLQEVTYLGHIISKDGIKPDPDKIKVVKEYPVPTSVKEVRQFLGLCSYYRKFIRNFSGIAAPLNQLTTKYARFVWTNECLDAFNTLREALITVPILCYPDFTLPFIIYTDACDYGIGGVLAQIDENSNERTISYASRALSKAERKYFPTERECLAIVYCVKYFRPYVYGRHFTISTDHNPLRWLQSVKDSCDRLLRWSLKLQEYDFTVVHRPGKAHRNADVVSRIKHKSIAALQPDASQLCTSSDVCDRISDFRRTTAAVTIETMDKVRDQQLTDPDLRPIILYLETRELPDDLSTARQIVASSDQYLMKNNILYHLSEHNLARQRPNIYCQLVIRPSMRNEILQSCHDDPLSGHLGFKKTYHKLRERFHWQNMYSDCDFWCKSCVDCATKKTPKQLPEAPLLPIPANYPFEKVAVDVL